ncbi:MAG: hypothetical protein ABIH41_06300 [Nanoarchaeota archaeon]
MGPKDAQYPTLYKILTAVTTPNAETSHLDVLREQTDASHMRMHEDYVRSLEQGTHRAGLSVEQLVYGFALSVAGQVHEPAFRGVDGRPYLVHPWEAASWIIEHYPSRDDLRPYLIPLVNATLLHDVAEEYVDRRVNEILSKHPRYIERDIPGYAEDPLSSLMRKRNQLRNYFIERKLAQGLKGFRKRFNIRQRDTEVHFHTHNIVKRVSRFGSLRRGGVIVYDYSYNGYLESMIQQSQTTQYVDSNTAETHQTILLKIGDNVDNMRTMDSPASLRLKEEYPVMFSEISRLESEGRLEEMMAKQAEFKDRIYVGEQAAELQRSFNGQQRLYRVTKALWLNVKAREHFYGCQPHRLRPVVSAFGRMMRDQIRDVMDMHQMHLGIFHVPPSYIEQWRQLVALYDENGLFDRRTPSPRIDIADEATEPPERRMLLLNDTVRDYLAMMDEEESEVKRRAKQGRRDKRTQVRDTLAFIHWADKFEDKKYIFDSTPPTKVV